MIEHRCLHGIGKLWWEVRRKVLGSWVQSLEEAPNHRRLRWLGDISRMTTERILRRMLCCDTGNGWNSMVWQKEWKPGPLVLLGTVRMPGQGSQNLPKQWLETLSARAQRSSHWRSWNRSPSDIWVSGAVKYQPKLGLLSRKNSSWNSIIRLSVHNGISRTH